MTFAMPTFLLPLTVLGVCCLMLSAAVRAWHRFGRCHRRGWLVLHPRYRGLLRRLGLSEFDHFLSLPGVIISGHPDRNVSVVSLGPDSLQAYLKREHVVPWKCRLVNALAGFGFVSRSLREAQTLQALQREGIGCPEWLAAGENERGQAFLLLRAAEGMAELRVFLQAHPDAAERLRLARRLGAALARLHETGFLHHDLYSKHILLRQPEGAFLFLDWQRARRYPALSLTQCARDLATLHATLNRALATPRQRLACWLAYVRKRPALWTSRRVLLGRILAEARQLGKRRHIREKCQLALSTQEVQDWVRLEGEALCVRSALLRQWPDTTLRKLSMDCQPVPLAPVARRWLILPGLPCALLVRRRSWRLLARLKSWLHGVPPSSPELRQAALLLRLQRHAVAAPRVLAMGQRPLGAWGFDSFLLSEPVADTLRFDTWLARHAGRSAQRKRGRLLRQAGTLLQRLHHASCYFRSGADLRALAVQLRTGTRPAIVLGEVEPLRASRRPQPQRARRDLSRLQQALAAAGCDRQDWRHFLQGYRSVATVVMTDRLHLKSRG